MSAYTTSEIKSLSESTNNQLSELKNNRLNELKPLTESVNSYSINNNN